MKRAAEVRVEVGRHSVRVLAYVDGSDVSRLNYCRQPVQVGPRATLAMAGIAGVGTDPEQRGNGLARQVCARALAGISVSGFSCAGLYTGTGNVAHRLYRQLGFVDIAKARVGAKLLDPKAAILDRMSEVLRAERCSRGEPPWRCLLQVEVRPHPPVCFRVRNGRAEPVSPHPSGADLSLAMDVRTFLGLFSIVPGVTPEFAEACGAVRWQGHEAHWTRLRELLAASHRLATGE